MIFSRCNNFIVGFIKIGNKFSQNPASFFNFRKISQLIELSKPNKTSHLYWDAECFNQSWKQPLRCSMTKVLADSCQMHHNTNKYVNPAIKQWFYYINVSQIITIVLMIMLVFRTRFCYHRAYN